MTTDTAKQANEIEPLMSIKEAARLLGYTHWSLKNWVRDGRLRCVRIGRGKMMFEPSELRRVIAEGKH